jgi:hypothetical protein
MVGSDQSRQSPGHFHFQDLDLSLAVDMVDVKDWEKSGVGAAPLQKREESEALEGFGQEPRGRSFPPLIEIPQ